MMEKMDDMDLEHLRPGARIEVPGYDQALFVLEDAREVREKTEDAFGSDSTALTWLTLTGMHLWVSRKSKKIEVELFEFSVRVPPFIVRSVGPLDWERQLGEWRQEADRFGGGGGQAQGVADLGGVLLASLGGGDPLGVRTPLSMEEYEANRETVCCCGHEASAHSHGSGETFVGQCGAPDCGCRSFHTHGSA